MLKNKSGYVLVETIITITIVAVIITTLYVSCMNYYIKQNNSITRFNTIQGLYSIREVQKYYVYNPMPTIENGLLYDSKKDNNEFFSLLNIDKIYYLDYDVSNVDFNEVPKLIRNELEKLDTSSAKFKKRYIVIFNDYSYATIGVEL